MARMLKRELGGTLTDEESEALFSAFDQVGGIIVIRIPDGLLHKKREIGQALLGQVKAARSVFCQSSDVGGDYRTRSLELLAGEDSTVTEYREHGCRFVVDVERAFFSPRLSTERQRIAELVGDSETVLNMFGGVGMFSIVAAKEKACRVYSIDSNPEAAALCSRNIGLNRLKGTVISVCGDAAAESEKITADRTLMVLPEGSDGFVPAALRATADGGVIHYYTHVHSDRKAGAPAEAERRFGSVCPARHDILGSRIVRAVGPRYYQAAVDARVWR